MSGRISKSVALLFVSILTTVVLAAEPRWIQDPQYGVDGVAVTGHADRKPGMGLSIVKNMAKTNAQASLAERIQMVIDASIDTSSEVKNGEAYETMKESIKASSKRVALSGAKVINTYEGDDGVYYLRLAILPKQIAAGLQSQKESYVNSLKAQGVEGEKLNNAEIAYSNVVEGALNMSNLDGSAVVLSEGKIPDWVDNPMEGITDGIAAVGIADANPKLGKSMLRKIAKTRAQAGLAAIIKTEVDNEKQLSNDYKSMEGNQSVSFSFSQQVNSISHNVALSGATLKGAYQDPEGNVYIRMVIERKTIKNEFQKKKKSFLADMKQEIAKEVMTEKLAKKYADKKIQKENVTSAPEKATILQEMKAEIAQEIKNEKLDDAQVEQVIERDKQAKATLNSAVNAYGVIEECFGFKGRCGKNTSKQAFKYKVNPQ